MVFYEFIMGNANWKFWSLRPNYGGLGGEALSRRRQ